MADANTPEKFWSRVDKTGDCWNWTGPKVGRTNYGKLSWHGKDYRAHRLAWELTNGPIPEGLCVLHKCDNPSCVRPDHLWLGTFDDNNKDMARKGRSALGKRNGHSTHPDSYPKGDAHYSRQQPERVLRGEKHSRAVFTEDQVREIRNTYSSGNTSAAKLAKHYGVSVYAVYAVIRRWNWKHVR